MLPYEAPDLRELVLDALKEINIYFPDTLLFEFDVEDPNTSLIYEYCKTPETDKEVFRILEGEDILWFIKRYSNGRYKVSKKDGKTEKVCKHIARAELSRNIIRYHLFYSHTKERIDVAYA